MKVTIIEGEAEEVKKILPTIVSSQEEGTSIEELAQKLSTHQLKL